MAFTDGMQLVFDDEFNKLDASPNGISTTWGDGNFREIGNYLQEYYADPSVGINPFTINNGELTITAAPSANPADTDGRTWTSGMIETGHSFSMEYGYFEMTATLPTGDGTWPAFWLVPSNMSWPPELDVMEHVGTDTTYHASVHSDQGDFNTFSAPVAVGNVSAGEHTYGVNWTPTEIDFYLDGNEVASTATPHGFDQPMYMIASLAVAKDGVTGWGGGAGANASTVGNASMVIDSIKAYANEYTQDIYLSDAAKATTAASTGTTYTPADTSHAPATHDVGTSDMVTTLHVSQDYYEGNAQFAVLVDGKQVGGTIVASALHGQGEDTINVHADLSAGDHTVSIQYLNDAYQWTADTDRNLYLDSATDVHGNSVTPTATDLGYTGAVGSVTVHSDGVSSEPANQGTSTTSSGGTGSGPADAGSHTPVTLDVGTGSQSLVLHLSEDVFQGDANYTIIIDGQQVGGTMTATALHGQGNDTLTLQGNFSDGSHVVDIQFLNDAYGGTENTDRNLYLENATTISGKTLTVDTGSMFATGDTASVHFASYQGAVHTADYHL